MATRRRVVSRVVRGRVRPLAKRLAEAVEKVDRLQLQDKIAELRAKVKRRRR